MTIKSLTPQLVEHFPEKLEPGELYLSMTLFEDNVAAAREWMNSPVRGLGSKRPLEMLRTRVETRAVVDLIGRLERGVLV